jgi:hypothetical protein
MLGATERDAGDGGWRAVVEGGWWRVVGGGGGGGVGGGSRTGLMSVPELIARAPDYKSWAALEVAHEYLSLSPRPWSFY